MIKVFLDFETQSESNLPKVGAIKYAQHPSTGILCLGYKIGLAETKIWVPSIHPNVPLDLERALTNKSHIFVAHNAIFEQAIYEFVMRKHTFLPALPPERWSCTASKAACVAIPRNLEGAALVMNLKVQKDMQGNRLIKKYMKPRTVWNNWYQTGDLLDEPKKYFDDPEELDDIYKYCITDVDTEFELDNALPDLIPFEREVWLENQRMNLRGVQIDIEAVTQILRCIEVESISLHAKAEELSGLKVTQREKLLKWVRSQGVRITNMQAGTVREIIKKDIPKNVKKVLKIRQAVSRTSTRKYWAMLERAGEDGRVRDLSMYHGASTGRESGTGLQIHNLPKGKIKDTDLAIDVIRDSDLGTQKLIYGDVMELYSSCIRGMVIPTPGLVMYAADFNAIECRVLNWIAGNEPVLKDFRLGRDPYLKMASAIYGVRITKEETDKRQLGKTAELGAGFQMGPDRFFQTCKDWGVNGGKGVPMPLAKKAIEIYRRTHKPVVSLWSNLERAAIKAVQTGDTIKINKTVWVKRKGFLWCTLPSGRKIAFRAPTVRNEPTPWGDLRPKLYHWSIDPKTKQWSNGATYGGKLTENVVQATARDIMIDAVLRMKTKGFTYLFSVHDEIIAEAKLRNGMSAEFHLKEFEKILTTLPPWAKGLPIAAKGWSGPRYKKA